MRWYAVRMAVEDLPAPEYVDPACVEWRPGRAENRGACYHCGDVYRSGAEILVAASDDHHRVLHESCWELYEGFLLAMAKDD